MAASQCPKCGHLFEVRDGSGEPLPLAHCTSCDAYYPAHVHSCKWCGTTLIPEKARKGESNRVRWIAAGTFAVAVLLGLLARDPGPTGPKAAPHSRTSARSKINTAAPADTLARVTPTEPTSTANAGEIAVDPNPVVTDVSVPEPATPASSGSAVIPQSLDARSTIAAAPAVAPSHATSTSSSRKRRASSPWVSMVAREWVIVRADADRTAHIVASVGPKSRVQLGEARGSWRRIKLRGIAGWVDVSGASFGVIPGSVHRARRVAGR
jgi:hypothetical protein